MWGSPSYLIGTRDDLGELTLLLVLPLDHRFQNTGMVRPQIDEAMRDAGLEVTRSVSQRWCDIV